MRKQSDGRLFLCIAIFTLFVAAGASGTAPPRRISRPVRRALLIGIERYTIRPGEVPAGARILTRATNLDGPNNDVALIRTLLKAEGFLDDNIHVLSRDELRRAALLRAIDEYLVKPADENDLSVLYFAGHGSYVPGGDPKSIFGQDETLVPADANLGVPDISGRELAERAHRVLDRGAQFIGIFDSCHSGTLFRGDLEGVRVREAPPAAVRPPVQVTKRKRTPAQRGALIVSATQPTEKALEKSLFGTVNGVFTRALYDAAMSANSAETVEQSMQRVEALMHVYGTSQAPDLDANALRRLKTMLGATPSAAPLRMSAVATQVDGRKVFLDIGQAMGVGIGAELERSSRLPTLRLKIKTAPQFTASLAESDVPASVSIGDAFAVVKAGNQRLADDARFYIESNGPPADELQRLVKEVGSLRREPRIDWITEPQTGLYTFEIYFSTDLRRLVLYDLCAQTITPLVPPWGEHALKLMLSPRPLSLRRGQANECAAGTMPALFVRLPPPQGLAATLQKNATWQSVQLQSVNDRIQADYALAGRITTDGHVQYSWMQPLSDTKQRSALPFRGRAWRVSTELEELTDDAVALHRIKSWLTLRTPKGNDPFAYHLSLARKTNPRELRPGPTPPLVYVDESYSFVLEQNSYVHAPRQRYVYIFNIDQQGQGACLWPYPCDNHTRLPAVLKDKKTITLDRSLDVDLPLGLDTLIMLSTEAKLPNARTLFNFTGMLKDKGAAPANDLERLLFSVGATSRGDEVPPSDWAIEHFPRITAQRP